MIMLVLVTALSLIAACAGAFVAFSPTKAVLAVSSTALSVALALLGVLAGGVRAIFWVAPTYLLLDAVVLYFIFATGLSSGSSEPIRKRTRFFLGLALSTVLVLFAMAAWELWQIPGDAPEAGAAAVETVASMHLLLWDANRPIVVLCFLLLAPAAIGSLLMVRQRN